MFSEDLAEIRFGCGLSPSVSPPRNRTDMLAGVTSRPDVAYARKTEIKGIIDTRAALRKKLNMASKSDKDALQAQYRATNRQIGVQHMMYLGATTDRWVRSDIGFHERLTRFWADHFAIAPRRGLHRLFLGRYVEETIRPNISKSFAELLIAVTTSAAMAVYLDQARSAGDMSLVAQRSGNRGQNENLAREILELHTLGVGGPYTQTDVEALAGLLTGLSANRYGDAVFRKGLVQPGKFRILGNTYDRDDSDDALHRCLTDLATHPATAQHIARKLSIHFVSDAPDQGLVDHIAEQYSAHDGDLMSTYAALLEHPAAWQTPLTNIKPHFDYFASALRALEVPFLNASPRKIRDTMAAPLRRIGQNWKSPNGPDGWPEPDEAWLTPQSMALRLQWAIARSHENEALLPDARIFIKNTLGEYASGEEIFAAKAAETKSEAIALVLISPTFQTR